MKSVIEEKLNEIEIPESLHERCVTGVMKAKPERSNLYDVKNGREGKKEGKNQMKKIVAAAAVVMVCVLTIGNTTFADGLKGMFKDVIGWNGAVTGTEYVNATEEVMIKAGEVNVAETNTSIQVEMTFLNAEEFPFRAIEQVEIDTFEILNANGDVVVSEKDVNVTGTLNNGIALLSFETETDKFATGETYTLVIESFAGCSKADAPLAVKGVWKCEFDVK